MSEHVTLNTDGYGSVAATVDTDRAAGHARYQVRGAGVTGVFVVSPYFADDHVEHVERVRITLGTRSGDRFGHQSGADDQPTVNRVVLVATTMLCRTDKLRAGCTRAGDLGLFFPRADGGPVSTNAARRACAVITAIVTHWLERPDNADLRDAAARHAAGDPQRQAANAAEIDRLHAQITELGEQLSARHANADHMRHLAAPPPATLGDAGEQRHR